MASPVTICIDMHIGTIEPYIPVPVTRGQSGPGVCETVVRGVGLVACVSWNLVGTWHSAAQGKVHARWLSLSINYKTIG